ncbi:MAG: hypothetical protein IKZ07_01785 [Akkermansia sp.]|nr:hypothetical protein [Akkermansia sp.]
MNLRFFLQPLLIAVAALSGLTEAATPTVADVQEPPMSYKGAPYLLWLLARWNDTIVLAELMEETVQPVQRGLYEPHTIKVRVLKTIKGAPLPDTYLLYTVVLEVDKKPTKHPGTYPLSGQLLLGFNRQNLNTNISPDIRHAGDLSFSKLNPNALRHLPMVKKDYPELFE